ncbi:MAG TPA: ABC transporter substrate-binding protein, partial [bacterium]|nr:ABC transporter substrate-binding protein [bacterium]
MDKIGARFAAIVALVAVVFSLQGAPAGAQAVPKQLRIAVGIDADTLDPAGQTTTTVANMLDYFFEPLVDMDYVKNEVVPRLATQWQTSRDGLTYTFQLRQGVTFHDGTPMTAAAVKSTFDRLLDPKTKVPLRGALLAGIKTVDVVDDTTVRFAMSQPNPLLLRNLTYTTTAIISPAALAKAGDRFGLAPVGAGTGPYTFKEWRRGESILVERTPTYWGKKPSFEEVLFQVVPDAGTRETMVLAGNVHLAMLPPAPDIKNLRKNPRVTLVEAPTDRVIFLAMNNQWGPFKDVRVRQAMNYAINKKALLTSILFDLGTVEASACPAMMFGHSPMREGGWPYDPAKAKQLLAEAGYKDGFDVE